MADLAGDARILWRMLCGQPRSGSHAERLQAFYAPQADRYDTFRARLLHGRQRLIDQLNLQPGERVVELGGGTGSSLARIGDRLPGLHRLQLVDLCPALLALAQARAQAHANVEVIEADATQWQPDQAVDVVFISYALTMIPGWQAVLDNAHAMLRPGGRIGVVDFHLPADASRLSKIFWQRWFAHDGVHLSDTHLPALSQRFVEQHREQAHARLPYLPGLHAPYYLFIGGRAGQQPACL